MTKLTSGQEAQVATMIADAIKKTKGEEKVKMDEVLERIKSLEEENDTLKREFDEMKATLTELTGKVETTVVAAVQDSSNVWKEMVKSKSVRNDISNMMVVEQNRSKRKEKNLIIFEKTPVGEAIRKIKTGTETAVVKEEVTRMLTAIGMEDHVEEVTLSRFKENGPILIACEELDVKMKILRAARELRNNGYAEVYINNDLTESEAANEKRLRVEQRTRNGALEHGTGFMKYGKSTVNGTEKKWFWGIRSGELRKIFKDL